MIQLVVSLIACGATMMLPPPLGVPLAILNFLVFISGSATTLRKRSKVSAE